MRNEAVYDAIERLRRWMQDNHRTSAEELARMDAEITAELDGAVAFAEAGTLEPLADLERFVTMDHVPQEAAR